MCALEIIKNGLIAMLTIVVGLIVLRAVAWVSETLFIVLVGVAVFVALVWFAGLLFTPATGRNNLVKL